MRSLMIILGGLVFWLSCLGLAKYFGSAYPNAMDYATKAFIAIWFLVAALNMWVGISQAGYSFKEELPIFLLIFLLPVAIALFVKWKLL
jgi:hypothetical protein